MRESNHKKKKKNSHLFLTVLVELYQKHSDNGHICDSWEDLGESNINTKAREKKK